MKRGNHGAGVAGLVLSIIAIVLSLIFTFACTAGKKSADVIQEEISTMDEDELESLISDLAEDVSEEVEVVTDGSAATN